MSSRKLDKAAFDLKVVENDCTHLTLPHETVRVHRNGIEFRSPVPFDPWVEMLVELELLSKGKKLSCNGVVVACNGSNAEGYSVAMHLTGLDLNDQNNLNQMGANSLR